MRTLLYALLGTSIALVGCDRQDAAVIKANEPKPVTAKAGACAPPPVLILSPGFEDPDKKFGSHDLGSTRSNFAAAYQKSCQNGLLRGEALMDAKSSVPSQLFLLNAPDANKVSIGPSGDENKPGMPRRMVLEYYYVTDEGTHVPSVDDIEEAIFCHVKGATPKEQEETGRCLPD